MTIPATAGRYQDKSSDQNMIDQLREQKEQLRQAQYEAAHNDTGRWSALGRQQEEVGHRIITLERAARGLSTPAFKPWTRSGH